MTSPDMTNTVPAENALFGERGDAVEHPLVVSHGAVVVGGGDGGGAHDALRDFGAGVAAARQAAARIS